MSLCYHEFLEEITLHKKVHGFTAYDDDYRQKVWLPYRPIDDKAVYLKERRKNWATNSETEREKRDYFRMDFVEKPTRIVEKGSIVGVGNPVPRYINRDPAAAKEFQGARLRININIGPDYPSYIPSNITNYLMRKNSPLHNDCLDQEKNSATLWRDLINATLDNKVISGKPQWYHPLVATAKMRFDQRWPEERRLRYPNLYFYEFCKLFHTASRIFVPDWIDEQHAFPDEDYIDTQQFY